MDKSIPIVGITMGDSLGVGPEIVAKAVLDNKVLVSCQPLIIGDRKVMERAFGLAGETSPEIRWFSPGDEFVCKEGTITGIDMDNNDPAFPSEAVAGKAAVEYIYHGIDLALNNKIAALATAPVNKYNMNKGGYQFPGVAEVLAKSVKRDYVTLLMDETYKISLVTAHVALKDISSEITKERVLFCIQKTWDYLKCIGKVDPKVAVCSANPHCGEEGLIGDDEITAIKPAVEQAQQMGINVVGPVQTPNIFIGARKGKYDAVISMFHEQAVSVIGSNNFTTMTLNLPFIRTSVGHGTADDIAWRGIADPVSMVLSIISAADATKNNQLTNS